MSIRALLVVLAVLALSGCAVTTEGVSSASYVHFVPEHVTERSVLPGSAPKTIVENGEERVITVDASNLVVIGFLSTARRYDDESAAKAWQLYIDNYDQWELERPPSISKAEFRDRFAGWTRIKYDGFPGVYGRYATTLVPASMMGQLGFGDAFTTVLWQGSADLVAARSNADGVFVVAKLLCAEGDGFDDCKSGYQRGIFDALTGRALSSRLVELPDTPSIDTDSYRPLN